MRLTHQGVEFQKWIVSGEIILGTRLVRKMDFEVDTGFPGLALSEDLWDEYVLGIVLAGGRFVGKVGNFGYLYDNCKQETLPEISYRFGGFRRNVRKSAFAEFIQNTCTVYNIDVKNDEGYGYLGAPFLVDTIVQFDQRKSQVAFCRKYCGPEEINKKMSEPFKKCVLKYGTRY